MQPNFVREINLIAAGGAPVAGVDEVGRGPLAGPVVAAAVILDPDRIPTGICDSKQLAKGDRERLASEIVARAHAVAIASASVAEIDALDIRRASHLAMRRSVLGLAMQPMHVLVDGRDLPTLPCAATAIVKGDASVLSIAAASIVAKVARDRMMTRLAASHPAYGFERHAGYPTAAHRGVLAEMGPCEAHRLSFRLLRD
jgi:ribonuclease HII